MNDREQSSEFGASRAPNRPQPPKRSGPIRVKLPARVLQRVKADTNLRQQAARRAAKRDEELQLALAQQADRVQRRAVEKRTEAAVKEEGNRALGQRLRDQEAERQLAAELGPPPPPTPATVTLTLTEGRLACPACGIAVEDRDDATGERIRTQHTEGRREFVVDYRRCPQCQRRQDSAAEVMSALPKVATRVGPRAVESLALALDAMAASRLTVPDLSDPAEVVALIHRVARVGVGAQWSTDQVSYNGVSTTTPWAHVSDEKHARARTAFAAVLADRLDRSAPPVRLAPSTDSTVSDAQAAACGFCGIGQVSVPAARVRALGGGTRAQAATWTLRPFQLGNLGGHGGVEPTFAWLCLSCDRRAADARGATIGALEAALSEHLAATGNAAIATSVRLQQMGGLVAWAALAQREVLAGRSAPEPRSERWSFIHTGTTAEVSGNAHDDTMPSMITRTVVRS